MTLQNVIKSLRRDKVTFFDLKYTDALGRLHHVTSPVERFGQVMRDGIGFDGSSVPGLKSVECGDMSLFPDLSTLFVDPFAAEPTASCLADMREPGEKRPHALDPRQVLRSALAVARKRLHCDDVWFLPEFEFYLLDKVSFLSDKESVGYRLSSQELSRDDETGYIAFGTAYHAAPPLDRSSDLRSEMCRLAGACGFPMKYHHHEGGRFSHVELEPELRPGLAAADGAVLTKYIIRNVAMRHGRTATFMPKPIFGEPGSGMHFHQYAVKDGLSLFGDRRGPARLSRLALQYIGGILHHAPSLCALTNPSTNSYKRLIPGFEAPTLVFFSVSNRTAAIRIPGYVTDPDQMVIEYRIPDGTCNPYLAMAAMVLAGVDGVIRKLDPGESFTGRHEDAVQAFGDRALPGTLPDAIAALEKDSDYLRRDGVFPAGLLDYWARQKRSEAAQVLLRPHPWEYNLYYGG